MSEFVEIFFNMILDIQQDQPARSAPDMMSSMTMDFQGLKGEVLRQYTKLLRRQKMLLIG